MNMRECSEIDQTSRHNKEAKPMNDTPAAERELVDLIVQCEQALDATEVEPMVPALQAVVEYLVRLHDRTHANTARGGFPMGQLVANFGMTPGPLTILS